MKFQPLVINSIKGILITVFCLILQQRICAQQRASAGCAEDHVKKGDAFLAGDKLRQAVAEYRAAIRLDQSNAIAHWYLAEALDSPHGKDLSIYNGYNKGNQDNALKEYQNSLRLDPKLGGDKTKSAEWHSRHAASYLGSDFGHWYSMWCGDFSDNWVNHCMDNAITEFRIALLFDPDYIPAHIGLGVVLEKLHKHDAAIEEFRAALRVDPESAAAHLGLGKSLEKKGKLQDALQEYGGALSLEEGRAKYEKLSAKLGVKKEQVQ